MKLTMTQEDYQKAYNNGFRYGVSLFANELTLKIQELAENLSLGDDKKGK